MRKIYLIAIFCLGLVSMQAQELKWHTDVKEAMAIGIKEKKPLLLFFTGSDWCGWCIRLQKEVLKTAEFTKWAKEKVILVELDYPRSVPQTQELKQQNYGLQNAFGVQGYPTVWFATPQFKDGKPSFGGLGKTGYVAGGPVAWLEVANGILNQK
ncbi:MULTISPECIES: thioredoxin family protein [Flavobacterium]|uniref:Thioredoxin family protein n=1 Tax=Flavobacterium commune TaxID=1306519 RepID=A0A1D9P834_9FLAO|nr:MULTISPECIES: thioredoxin family protein [Flavobacterium]AOZ98723.1 thioredoxin family protein [Flavobacterium commune]